MKTLTLWNRAEMIASIGAWEWDIEHDQWNFTDGFRRIHGFPDCATLTLRDLKASVYPADLPAVEETLAAALAGKSPFTSEHRTIRRDTGEVRWVQTWGEVDVDARGKPIRLSGVSQDVTERKLAELANARLAAVIESTSDAVISRDLAGNITSWNAGAETLFGYTAAEMTGTPGLQIIPPERATEYQQLVERLQGGEAVPQVETVRLAKDGHRIDVSMTVSAIKDVTGDVVGAAVILRDISHWKQTEDVIKVNLTKYASLFESAPMGITVTDQQGKILEANLAAERLLSVPRTEHVKRTYDGPEWTIVRPDGTPMPAAEYASVRALTEDRLIENVEMGIVNDAGTTTWISVNAIPIRLPGYGVIITYTDISTRRQAEIALAASEARLKAIIENSSSNIWSIDRAYRLLAGNGAFERNVAQWIGRKLEPGETVLEPNFSPVAAAFWRPLYDRALAGESFVIEMPSGLRRDRTLECRLNPIRDADGNITGVAGQTFDITDRLATEKELREALQYQKLAADAADIGIWNWDIADNSLDWDVRMCDLYAIPHAACEAGIDYDVWRSIVHPDDLAVAERSLRNDGDSNTTFRIVLPDGQIRHIYSAFVVERNQLGEAVRMIGINRDVTEQKLYEQLLEDANLELERRVAHRTAELERALHELKHANDAKDAFLNAISHELRTPLSGMLTMADVLEMQTTGVLNESQLRYVRMIRENGDRLLNLVESVLHYTALIGGRVRFDPAPCRLVEVGAMALHAIRKQVESKQLTAQFSVDPLDLEIISDATDLLPVLNKLLDNAVKFTPAGGKIGLVIGRDVDHAAATLTVWDTGIGIAPEHQTQIFTPFHQVDLRLSREYEGVGLGLAYVRAMVALLGGSIAVESELGKGSRFVVTLPFTPVDPKQSGWARSRAIRAPGGSPAPHTPALELPPGSPPPPVW